MALASGVRPVSRDLLALSSLVAALLVLGMHAGELASRWRALFAGVIEATRGSSLVLQDVFAQLRACLSPLLYVGAAVLVSVLLASAAQGSLSLRSHRPLPFSVTSQRGLQLAWLAVKALVIVAALASVTHAALRAMLGAVTADMAYAGRVVLAIGALGVSRVGIVLALLVVGDAIVMRVLWRRSLRMTHDELRRELREAHGDPSLRGEQQRRQRQARAVD